MKYLLDTDTLSMLTKPSPPLVLLRRMAATDPAERVTSSVTLAEIHYGALRIGRRGLPLLEHIETAALAAAAAVIPFDAAAAREFGRLRTDLEGRGMQIGFADTQIAAIALSRGLSVVTGNVRHFGRVPGLAVENWIAG